jgi:hypothetical protein
MRSHTPGCVSAAATAEIHVYDDAGENIIEKIPIDDRIKYLNA